MHLDDGAQKGLEPFELFSLGVVLVDSFPELLKLLELVFGVVDLRLTSHDLYFIKLSFKYIP